MRDGSASFHVGGGGKKGGKGKKKLLQNLDASTAIITSPEEALALLNLNRQLDQPYEVKGAYLI